MGGTLIGLPMVEYLVAHDKPLLVFVPFMAVALGDGLAEPVGKLFGKHKYQTRALFTDKKFTRSYEGSATVFFFALIAVFIASPQMNWAQLVLSVLTIPIANTLAEAWSPHTMDNHMMLGITWLLLWLIFDVLPLERVQCGTKSQVRGEASASFKVSESSQSNCAHRKRCGAHLAACITQADAAEMWYTPFGTNFRLSRLVLQRCGACHFHTWTV